MLHCMMRRGSRKVRARGTAGEERKSERRDTRPRWREGLSVAPTHAARHNHARMQTHSHTLVLLPMGAVRLDWGPVSTRVPFAAINMFFFRFLRGRLFRNSMSLGSLGPQTGHCSAVIGKESWGSPAGSLFLSPWVFLHAAFARARKKNGVSRKQTSPYLR